MSDADALLSSAEILSALTDLGERLAVLDVTGELLLTGGAALCLVHEARDATKDVDALYEPKQTIDALVRDIAQERGLPADWLNDSVKGFVAPTAPVKAFRRLANLDVSVVSPEYLLAMKLISARAGAKDLADIGFLIEKLGLESAEQVYDVLARFYPCEQVLPKTMYVIEEFFQATNSTNTIDRGETGNELLGMWKDRKDIEDVEQYLRNIRKGRK